MPGDQLFRNDYFTTVFTAKEKNLEDFLAEVLKVSFERDVDGADCMSALLWKRRTSYTERALLNGVRIKADLVCKPGTARGRYAPIAGRRAFMQLPWSWTTECSG